MKNRIVSVFIPLLLASSLYYAADDIQQTQQQMNVFKSALKQFQKKMNLYTRCLKRECSQEEKDQALSDMKKTAKIAIPAAIGLITGILIYKYRDELRIFKTFFIKERESKFLDSIYYDDFDTFKSQIKAWPKLDEDNKAVIAERIVHSDRKDMMEALLEQDDSVANMRDDTANKRPLVSIAIFARKTKIAELLLNQPNINVHVTANNNDPTTAPLYLAAYQNYRDLLEKILPHYSQDQLKRFLHEASEVKRSSIFPTMTEQENNDAIQKIKNAATNIGLI